MVKIIEKEYQVTDMMRKFVRFYIEQDFKNGAQAARRAGSTADQPRYTANKWLKHPWVQKQLEKARSKVETEAITAAALHRDEVIEKLRGAYDTAMSNGKTNDAVAAAKALAEIGGFVTQKKEETKNINHFGISRDEALKRLKRVSRTIDAPAIQIERQGDGDEVYVPEDDE